MFRKVLHGLSILFLRWRIQIRHLPKSAKVIASVIFVTSCAAPFWRYTKPIAISRDKSVWTDVILGTALLAIIPFILAAYGGHLAAETIGDPRRRRSVKLKFWGLCTVGVLLAFLQQYRSINEESKNEQKNDRAQTQIITMLTDLHGSSGVMTEAERRKKILDVLRERYVLTHDVDQSMIDGTEAPPFDWVNGQLKQLGENWSVTAQPPSAPLSVPPRPRSYLAIDGAPVFGGSSPDGTEGSNFRVGDPLGFNVHYRATGPNAIYAGSSAMMTILETDSQPATLNDAYKHFQEKVAAEKQKQPDRLLDQDWTIYTPGTSRFNTAYAWDEPEGHETHHIVTQTDLDDLRLGTEVAVVIAFFDYKDGNQIHHLWFCSYLQAPAQPLGIWHFFDGCPKSD